MRRLGLDGLHVGVGAVRRGRLVLGLLVLHGVDDLVVGRRDRGARDGADDEDPARIYDVGVRFFFIGYCLLGATPDAARF